MYSGILFVLRINSEAYCKLILIIGFINIAMVRVFDDQCGK